MSFNETAFLLVLVAAFLCFIGYGWSIGALWPAVPHEPPPPTPPATPSTDLARRTPRAVDLKRRSGEP